MRRKRLTRRPGAAVAVLAAVVAVVVVAARRTAASATESEPQPDPGTTAHDVRQDPQQVRDHWTPERMREAGNAPMPKRD